MSRFPNETDRALDRALRRAGALQAPPNAPRTGARIIYHLERATSGHGILWTSWNLTSTPTYQAVEAAFEPIETEIFRMIVNSGWRYRQEEVQKWLDAPG